MDEHTLQAKTGTAKYVQLLSAILRGERPYSYVYMNNDEYGRLVDLGERSRIYWYEIVERAHCAAFLSLLRTERWWSAMLVSAQGPNFLPFAASFRGLLESAADTRHALDEVPYGMASMFKFIKPAVHGRLPAVVLAPVLEDSLIHFSHGRKLKKGEQAPESHAAKTMQEYLNVLEGAPSGPMHECYAALCNITHPAADSVLYLLEKKPDDSIGFCSTADEEAVVELCDSGGTIVTYAVSESLLYPVIILKIINRLLLPELQTPVVDKISLSESPLWAKIEPLLSDRV